MPKVPYEKLKFIFYIPGSMGSLLSLLIKSQIENIFVQVRSNIVEHCLSVVARRSLLINTFKKIYQHEEVISIKI